MPEAGANESARVDARDQRQYARHLGNIGVAEIILLLVVGAFVIAVFVGLVALGTRLGTRHLRNKP